DERSKSPVIARPNDCASFREQFVCPSVIRSSPVVDRGRRKNALPAFGWAHANAGDSVRSGEPAKASAEKAVCSIIRGFGTSAKQTAYFNTTPSVENTMPKYLSRNMFGRLLTASAAGALALTVMVPQLAAQGQGGAGGGTSGASPGGGGGTSAAS